MGALFRAPHAGLYVLLSHRARRVARPGGREVFMKMLEYANNDRINRHGFSASTAQAVEQENLLSNTLADELAATRSELDTKVALADKAVEEAAQLRRAAEITTAELQKSLQREHEKSAALANELTKARIDLEAMHHDETFQRSQAAVELEAGNLRR